VTKSAMLLTGPLGLGHEMMARCCGQLLEQSGWHVRRLDSMSLLGPLSRGAGMWMFNRLVAIPGLYDGLHFAHLRTGSRLADRMDRASCAKLVPALRAELERRPADLVVSVFATGASAAARLKAHMPDLRTVVLCTDVAVHRIWAAEGTDLFLVTSAAAAESVRRFLPRAPVAVVPPPVRSAFYAAPDRNDARATFGVPPEDFCVLVIDSGWGLGPLVESVSALAAADHAVRFHRPGARADGRLRPGIGPARGQHVRGGPGGGARPSASRRDAGSRAGQPAARTGAGPGARVRGHGRRGDRQRAGAAGPGHRPDTASSLRTEVGAGLRGRPAADRP
jgi:processive 1,2-diacylglycerol beta-glucosyltransferase